MIRLLSLLIICCLCLGCKSVFRENFNDNRNNWPIKNTDIFNVNVANGRLNVEKFMKNKEYFGCLWYSKTIQGLYTNLDFTMQFDVKIIKELDDYNSFEISWGSPIPDGFFYQFSFTNTGSFRFDRFSAYDDKKWLNTPQLLKPGIVKPQEFNHVKISQRSDSCFVYVNQALIFKKKIMPVYGRQIGFLHCQKMAWELDNLVIKYN